MCRSKSGRRCRVRKNSYITTQYSTSELEALFKAANRVCGKKFGDAPALLALKQRAVTSQFDNHLIVLKNAGSPGAI